MKKSNIFSKLFNIFEIDLYSRSYKSAAIRIGASLSVMLIVCLIRFSISIPNPIVNLIVSGIVLVIMILAILCFFIATVECLQVGDNIKKDKQKK